ncbi:MAG: hypothetical protein QM775_35155 [Pirellulales bacterium]
MLCDFQPTGDRNPRGLPKLRCSRAGCRNVCFTKHPPAKIRFTCRHPQVLALGEATAAAIKIATLGLVREKPDCGCARRRKRWNERFTLAVPNWLYRIWRKMRNWNRG